MLRFKNMEETTWVNDARFSSMGVDFDWYEKGCKLTLVRDVERNDLLEEVLKLVEYVHALSETQVNILRIIYQNRRFWGLIEYNEEFEIYLAKKLNRSRKTIDVNFKTLGPRSKKLMEVIERGKIYRVMWERLPSPVEVAKGEFVMIALKVRVKGALGNVVEGD